MSRTSKAWEALQERLQQSVETVSRAARVDVVSGGVDEIDPPQDLDELADQAKNTGPVRKNLRQFVNDVWEVGYSVEAESEQTQAYFEGGDNAPEGTPEGGFMENSAVFGGEKQQDFYPFGKATTWQRWVRGTILIELIKADPDDAESPITGFYHIRPETVYPQVENNTNILLPPDPDDLPDDINAEQVRKTRRGEVAAYIQFDDESILGIRRNGFHDRQEIPLSQNDVMKQTLDPDIGDDFGLADAQGVFGTSILSGISTDIEEYKSIKRDRAEAISRKAYGIYTAQFKPEVIDRGDTQELIEWDDKAIQNAEGDLKDMGPGDVFTSDANIDLEKYESEVPDLEGVINQYISIMLAPLPAPKYLIGFAEGINRDISEEQKEGYHDLISQERRYQETKWTKVLKEVAKRQGLDPEGLKLKLEPQTEENPVKSLSTEEIDRMNTYISTLSAAAGPRAGPTAIVDREELLDVLDFPVDDMENPQEVVDEIADTEANRQAWNDVMGIESLATQYDEGDEVDTPSGIGVVVEIRTEDFEGPSGDMVEASEDSPAYIVGVEEGAEVFRASDITEDEIEVDIDNPEEALISIVEDGDWEALQPDTGLRFDYPPSWRKSPQPNRLILLKAWAGLGGRFTSCRREMVGEVAAPSRFCASMKDRVLEWEGWRQGG